jgi:glycosyltransferase involved in cell wall biosynthesis
MGRFDYEKGFDLLVKAFSELKDKEARLVILGDGPERSTVELAIRAMGVEDRVFLPGGV